MNRGIRTLLSAAVLSFGLAACGGGGGGGGDTPPPTGGGGTPPPTSGGGGGGGTPAPTPDPEPQFDAFETPASTTRFLTKSTFGPAPADVTALTGTDASDWFIAELNKTATLNGDYIIQSVADASASSSGLIVFRGDLSPRFSFLINAIEGDDQLRQRMAFALSEIIVASVRNSVLQDRPYAMGYFQDVLTRNALGNYRDLIEDVTYSPAMGEYLTYHGNRAGDPMTGQVPDENYAREIMQLFTIGLVDLQMNGEPVLDSQNNPVESYDNTDITGLAKVFTGLSVQNESFDRGLRNEIDSLMAPMQMFPEWHSDLEKQFLNTTIPAGTDGVTSIDLALDALVDHQNTPPFIGKQLIQRLVTSNPSPEYVERVATAFADGEYTLPNGTVVGDGRRGDLAATAAAILFDEEALDPDNLTDDTFGKVREPILRFTHWARAFEVTGITPEFVGITWDTGRPNGLGQQAYGSPSVFNFFRPGYVAPGTESADAGLVTPELQIMNASTAAGYFGFMQFFIENSLSDSDSPWIDGDSGATVATAEQLRASFLPDYTEELALVETPADFVEHLNQKLLYGTMSDGTRAGLEELIEEIPLTNQFVPTYDGRPIRLHWGILFTMNSPDYLVQR